MIIQLFSWLHNALTISPLVAISAAFIWGILSILLSPCHLSSIPLIIGFIDKQEYTSVKRAFWLSLFFSTGILILTLFSGLPVPVMKVRTTILPAGQFPLCSASPPLLYFSSLIVLLKLVQKTVDVWKQIHIIPVSLLSKSQSIIWTFPSRDFFLPLLQVLGFLPSWSWGK